MILISDGTKKKEAQPNPNRNLQQRWISTELKRNKRVGSHTKTICQFLPTIYLCMLTHILTSIETGWVLFGGMNFFFVRIQFFVYKKVKPCLLILNIKGTEHVLAFFFVVVNVFSPGWWGDHWMRKTHHDLCLYGRLLGWLIRRFFQRCWTSYEKSSMFTFFGTMFYWLEHEATFSIEWKRWPKRWPSNKYYYY